MSVISLIASENFIAVNKTLIRTFGIDEAIMLGELASEFEYWNKKGELDENGCFFSTIENIEENTGIKEKKQRAILNSLKEQGLIEIRLKGLPAKRYIKLNEEKLVAILLNSNGKQGRTRTDKTAELEQPEKPTNKNNINKISNKNKEIYIAVCDCLNYYAKTNYKASSAATQRLINARVAEGFTVEDFETVIKKKCTEWKGSEMEKYLRPETLFGTKFENYLNAKQTTTETPRATNNFKLTGGLNL